MGEERPPESSTFSYLWYSAIWYLFQYIVITGLHFLSVKQINKKVLQSAASDTLLLTLVFYVLQWAGSLLTGAIYRLPYVIIHMFVELIPTLLCLMATQLLMLSSLGLAQKLYHHLSYSKVSTASIKEQMDAKYLVSICKSQQRLEDAINRQISKLFPKLVQKHEQQAMDTTIISLVFASAFLLLQLSTLAIVLLETTWETLKTCYHRISSKRVKDVKPILLELIKLSGITMVAACFLQYKATRCTVAKGKQLLINKAFANRDNKSLKSKSISANNGTSVEDCSESNAVLDTGSGDSLGESGKVHSE